MVMQVVMVMVYYHQPNLKANKSREVLNLSSGCVENTRDSKESLAPGTFSGNVNNWVRLIPSNLSAFVGDHIVQAKAPQQQWGICKGLGHLMLCIFVHSIHPAHVDISMLSKCQMVRSKYRVQIRYITLPTSTQTTSSTNIAGSNMVK